MTNNLIAGPLSDAPVLAAGVPLEELLELLELLHAVIRAATTTTAETATAEGLCRILFTSSLTGGATRRSPCGGATSTGKPCIDETL
jgi:hypothetical protein